MHAHPAPQPGVSHADLAVVAANASATGAPVQRTPIPGTPLRIVVVDDFSDLREALMTSLAGPGRLISGAGSGRQLDSLLRGQQFDVALLDVNLPGESGYAIAARLRPLYPGMRLLMITAHGRQIDMPQPSAFDALLEKPVDLNALEALLLPAARATA